MEYASTMWDPYRPGGTPKVGYTGALWISCPPKHVMWQRVIRGTGEFKVRNWIQGTGWEIYLRWLSELALFIFATPR